mgnify:CR=1 FL=1
MQTEFPKFSAQLVGGGTELFNRIPASEIEDIIKQNAKKNRSEIEAKPSQNHSTNQPKINQKSQRNHKNAKKLSRARQVRPKALQSARPESSAEANLQIQLKKQHRNRNRSALSSAELSAKCRRVSY